MSVNQDFHHEPRPLVADSITGVRSFRVDKLGRLTGVSHKKVWTPGLNTATCPHLPIKEGTTATDALGQSSNDDYMRKMMQAFSIGGQVGGWYAPERKPLSKDHRPGGADCECGFWAYFDGSDDFSGDETVTGVVRAQGVVTVGSKGFRAEQAELVALVEPESVRPEPEPDVARKPWHDRFDRLSDWVDDHDGVAFVIAPLAFVAAFPLGAAAFADHAAFAIPAVLLLALSVLLGTGTVHGMNRSFTSMRGSLTCSDRGLDSDSYSTFLRVSLSVWREGSPVTAERWQATRRAYPEVPVYPSLRAALREHPLTPPPAPEPITPDNTPDFWTRKA